MNSPPRGTACLKTPLTGTMLFFFLAAYLVISVVVWVVYPWRDSLKICAVPVLLVLAAYRSCGGFIVPDHPALFWRPGVQRFYARSYFWPDRFSRAGRGVYVRDAAAGKKRGLTAARAAILLDIFLQKH